MSTPTTRRYPRTLQEAFPHEARHAYAIEHSRAPMGFFESIVAWASVGGMCFLIAWAIAA